MSDDSLRQFKQGNAETFKQLLEEKFDHIVTKISPQTWTCVYKFFIENTETENFLKCIEMLSEQGLKEFEKDATVERMKVCIPHNTTVTWIDQELEKARANDDDQKKWIQAKPLLKSTVNKGLAILFSKNTNDVPDVIDILQAMPLEQFMDVLQSCNENILETSLFLTDEELKEDARKETSFGSGKITEERDGVYEVQLKFGICFIPDPARKDDWGGSKLEPTPPPPDVDTQEVIQADVDAQGGAQLPATPVMFEDVVPTAAGTPAFDAETPTIANMTFLPQTPDEPEVPQVVQDDEPQAVAETPSETAQAQQDIDSPVLAASPPASTTLPVSLEDGAAGINDKSVIEEEVEEEIEEEEEELAKLLRCVLRRWCTFGSQPALVKSGKVYYEFTLSGRNLPSYPQAGWATPEFKIRPKTYVNNGCGDNEFSWGVDGSRRRKWFAGSQPFDVRWHVGDTIGVAIDVDSKTCYFGKNGEWKEGFSDMKIEEGVFPCLSMDNTQIMLNLGSAPFKFPGPTPEFRPVCTGNDAMKVEQLRGSSGSFSKYEELDYIPGEYKILNASQVTETIARDSSIINPQLNPGEHVNIVEVQSLDDRIRGRFERGWISLKSTRNQHWVWAIPVKKEPKNKEEVVEKNVSKKPESTSTAVAKNEHACFCLELLVKLQHVFQAQTYTWYRNRSWIPSIELLTNPPKPLRQSVLLNAYRIQYLLSQLLENEELVRFHSMVKTDHWEVILPLLPEVGILRTISPDIFYRYPSVLYVDVSVKADTSEIDGVKFYMSDKSEFVCECQKYRDQCNFGPQRRFVLDDDEWITQLRCHIQTNGTWNAIQIITNSDRRSEWYGKKEGMMKQFAVSDMEQIYKIDLKSSEPIGVTSSPCILHLLGKDLIQECSETTDGQLQQLACEAIGHTDYYSMQIWNELLYRCLDSDNLLYWTLSTLHVTGFWNDIWKRTNSEKPCDFMKRVIATQSAGLDEEKWVELVPFHRNECLMDMQRCFKALLYGENIFPGTLQEKAGEWKTSDVLAASEVEIWETVEHMEGTEIIQMCKDLVVYWLKTLLPSLAENDCIESLSTGGGVRNFVKEIIKHTLTGKTKPISAKDVQEHLEKRKYSQQKAEEYVRQLFRFLKKSVEDTLEFTDLFPMIDVMGSDEEKLAKLQEIGFEQDPSFFQAVAGLSEIAPDYVYTDGDVKTKHIAIAGKSSVNITLDRTLRNSLFVFEISFQGSDEPVAFKVTSDGNTVKFDETISESDMMKGVVLLRNCSTLTLSVEPTGLTKDDFVGIWRSPSLVPIIPENDESFTPRMVRFRNNKTGEFVKAGENGDFASETLFKLKPLQCVDSKWHCTISRAKSIAVSSEVEVSVLHSGHDQTDGVFTKKAGETEYWKKVNQDLSFGLIPDFKNKAWFLKQSKAKGQNRTIQVNRNFSEIPPASGWMFTTDPKNTPYTVPWASVNQDRAVTLPSGSDGWSYDSSSGSIPCHCVIKFDKVLKIKEVRIKNGYEDHDCAKELAITPLDIKTVPDDYDWSKNSAPWDLTSKWSFTSEKALATQSFVAPSKLPKSQYFRFTVEGTYGGYPYIKWIQFDTEQDESMSDMTISMENSSHIDYFEQQSAPRGEMKVCDFSIRSNCDNLPVYARDNTSSEVVDYLQSGTVVEVTQKQGDWFQLSTRGWVQKRFSEENWDTLIPLPNETKIFPEIVVIQKAENGFEVTGSDGKPILGAESTFAIYDEYNSVNAIGVVLEAMNEVFVGESRIKSLILEYAYVPEIRQGWEWIMNQEDIANSFTDAEMYQSLISTKYPQQYLDKAYSFSENLVLHTGQCGNKHFVEWAKPGAAVGNAFLEIEVASERCVSSESEWSKPDDTILLENFLQYVEKDRKNRHLSNIAIGFPNVSHSFLQSRLRYLLEQFSGQVLFEGDKVLSLQEDSLEIDFEGTILRTHERTHEIKALKKITRYEYISEDYGYIFVERDHTFAFEPSYMRSDAPVKLGLMTSEPQPFLLWQYDGSYIRNKEDPELVIECESVSESAIIRLNTQDNERRTFQQWDFDGKVFRIRAKTSFCMVIDLQESTLQNACPILLKTFEDENVNQNFTHAISRGGFEVGQKLQLLTQKATVQFVEENGDMLVELEHPVEKCEDTLVCLNPKLIKVQLMKICKEGGETSIKKLKKLIELSDGIEDGVDADGCSSLILAVKNGHREIIAMLLACEKFKNQFDINWKDNSGYTAYLHAKQKGFVDVMEALIAQKATDLPLPADAESVLFEHVFVKKPIGFQVKKGLGGAVISSFSRDDIADILEIDWKLVKINDTFVEKMELEKIVNKIAEDECPLRILFRKKEEPKKKKKKSKSFDPLDFQVGDKTECLYTINGNYYACTIESKNPDGTYNVTWDDGDSKDRRDHPKHHFKPKSKPCLCSKGHAMEITRGMPLKPDGTRYQRSVQCNGCGATNLESKGDFYHCTPCSFDFCMDCATRRQQHQCLRCATDLVWIESREQLMTYTAAYMGGYECNICRANFFPMWHCPNPSGGESNDACKWDGCTNCLGMKEEQKKVYVETIEFSNSVGRFELCHDEDKRWVYKKDGSERITNCGFQFEENGTIHVSGLPVGPWPGADSVRVLLEDQETVFQKLWNHPDHIRMLTKKTRTPVEVTSAMRCLGDKNVPSCLQGGAAMCCPGNRISLETRTPSLIYIGLEENSDPLDDVHWGHINSVRNEKHWGHITNVNGINIYCRFMDSPIRLELPTETTMVVVQALNVEDIVSQCIQLGKDSGPGWNRFFSIPTVEEIGETKLSSKFLRLLNENEEKHKNGLLYEQLMECENFDWCEQTVPELDEQLKLGANLLNKIMGDRIRRKRFDDAAFILNELCIKTLAEVDVTKNDGWKYFDLKIDEDLICTSELKERLYSISNQFKSESFRPHLKNLMKYENLEGLQNVERQVDFLDFMTHFHDENLILLSSLEFVRTAQSVFTTLSDWSGECSVLLAGNRWNTASVKGLTPDGQVEVFCKNDTESRLVNFNQIRLSSPTQTFFGEEKVVCTLVEADNDDDITKDWYRGTLREFRDDEALVDREPRENKYPAVMKVSGPGDYAGMYYRSDQKVQKRFFYEKLGVSEPYVLYYNNDQWRLGTKGRSFLKDPDAPIQAFVVSEAIYPHEIKETWMLYNSMKIELQEPELKISVGEKKDESVFHLDEEKFWTCNDGQKQQVYWCETSGSFQVLNLNKGYVWAKLEVQANTITLRQMKMLNIIGAAAKGDRDDKTMEIGFEFTAKQTFTVERFGRAYSGEKLAENAKVTLWDVKTQSSLISEMVGPEAKITEQHPGWMSIDVSSHGRKCEQGKKYRLTLRVTEGMKDKWAENCEPLQGIENDFVEIGNGVCADVHGVYPVSEEEVSKYLGNMTIFFEKEIIYNASVEDNVLKWDDGDVWSPHATMEMTFDPVCLRMADAILPKDKESNEMRRCIGCVSNVAQGFSYKCSWCNRTNIEQIDKYYHFSSDTHEVVCYQCYNDRTDYVPLASKTIESAEKKFFRDLWGTCAYVQKVPPLFPKLEKLLADDTKYRKGPHSYVGSLDELRDAAANASITLSSPQGQSVLESILREHEKLVELEHIARFRRALQKCEYDELVSISEIKILEKIDWSTAAGVPSETIKPEKQNACLRYVQERLLKEITGEELPDLNTEEPGKVQKEIDTIKNLVKLAEELKEDPTAEPPKVVSKTVQQTISKIFSSQRLEFENGKIWLDSMSQILNSDLVKALLDIPESYAQTLVNWFFKDRKPGEDYCVEVPEPILRSPTLQRMRTFTKVMSLDLQDQKAKKMAQDQTHLFAEVAKAMDLHTLLELVRKDVHGFGLKGLEPDFSQNILSTVIRSYKNTPPENRPPESIYNNVLVNIIDRMIEMQFWDEIKYTIQNVPYPDSIKDKIHSYELVMKLKSNVNGPDIIQKILLNEVSNLDDIRKLLAEIKNGDEENIRKLLSLPHADRKHMIILFDTDEVDYNVDCSICFSLPALAELPCKHKICTNCVKALKKSYSSKCPFCRTRIT